ncbi:Hypothetical protein R9X50_00619600 [Acrodontium crateriforme]|uniref:Uncharacterized protein n=1 Tax=Acrodontium crateriforme TaxID=150365 RepID=A0AAQ3M7W0_9PEZI|nr:Hypothetical protein R9X50_00619600 [Acrodontium crateriforme]
MDPTTLITFMFRAPVGVRIVELLGSWDNFSQPYLMNHDPRRGNGFYSGCFKFDKIIYDGDSAYWTKARSGGLKQGGTYWFYYRLDMTAEAYDDKQAHTNDCPLLPGQTVNFIDIPKELEPPAKRRRSIDVVGSLMDLATSKQTMNPADKFLPLYPPPVSKIHPRCISDLALGGRLEGLIKKNSAGSSKKSRQSKRSSLRTRLFPNTKKVRSIVAKEGFPVNPNSKDASRSTSTSSFLGDPFSNFDFEFRPHSRAGNDNSFADLIDIDPLISRIMGSTMSTKKQNFTSRPSSSSYSTDLSQSAIYSLSNTDISPHIPTSGNVSFSTFPNPNPRKALSPHPEEEKEDSNDLDDIWSPALTVDTGDTNSPNSPYYISASSSRFTSPTIGCSYDQDTQASVQDVAQRLAALRASSNTDRKSSNVPTIRAPPRAPKSQHPALRSTQEPTWLFAGYSLPRSETDSAHHLPETKIPAMLKTEPATTNANSSNLKDFMSDMGYLATSIN